MKAKKQILFIVIIGIVLIVLLAKFRPITKTEPAQSNSKITPTLLNPETPSPSQSFITATVTTQAVISDAVVPVVTKGPFLDFRPGGLLTNESRSLIYYITADGTSARRIESWMTFYALGFRQEAVFTVDEATLDQIPLSGHLTQHLYDDSDYRYWAVDGFLWASDA